MLRSILQLDPASYREFLYSIGFIAAFVIVFAIAMNWRVIWSWMVSVQEAYSKATTSITPEKQLYLDDTNLFI